MSPSCSALNITPYPCQLNTCLQAAKEYSEFDCSPEETIVNKSPASHPRVELLRTVELLI